MKKNTLIILLLFVVLGHAQDDNYTIKNIKDNSKYSDFGPTYYGDNKVIYASSRKVKGKRNKTWYKNSQPFLELYKATVDSTGEFVESNLFSKNLNTKYHESNVAFTNDEKTIYFSSDNYTDKKRHTDKHGWVLIQLYKAIVDSTGTWVDIKKLPFNSDEFDTGHPSLSADNSILYFTSNRPGSYGLTDIWAVDVLGEDSYGEPYNLGPNVNSTRSEMFPYIDSDNILYYSSDGKNYGNGGLDLYAVKIKDRLGMNEAVNLGLPLNSLKDDFSMVFQKGKKTGHFSSNRDGGRGDDDIYYFEELVNPIRENCKQLVQGVVREKETGALLPGALVTLYNAKGEKAESIIADKFASFAFNVDCEAGYKVTGSKEFYDMDEESFTTSNVADLALSIGLDLGSNEFVFVRDKLMIKINPIYFDLDRSFIRPDAALELERVLTIMQKYPLIKISLGSHTDSRAADTYNWALSNRRANSSRDWLIKAGIDPSRLTARGYGETELVNTCSNGVSCSEYDHQLNRRTEFVITNPEVIK